MLFQTDIFACISAIYRSSGTHGDVEAALLDFVLHITVSSFLHVIKSTCEIGLELAIVGTSTAVETDIGDIDGCTITMGTILRGIDIDALEALDIAFGAETGGDDETTVCAVIFLPALSQSREEIGSIGHKIWHRLRHRIKFVVTSVFQMDELAFECFKVFAALLRLDAKTTCSGKMSVVDVVEVARQIDVALAVQITARELTMTIVA